MLNSEKIIQKIKEDLFAAHQAVFSEQVEIVKETLSAPYPPASTPGEAPHMRTGELMDSIGTYTLQSDSTVESALTASASYAGYLQDGTPKMEARPFMPDLSDVVDKIKAKLER